MKIGNNSAGGVGSGSAAGASPVAPGGATGSAAKTGKAGAGAEASSTVKLSKAATALLDGAGKDASFDAAKVEQVRQSIADGTYQINAEAIADKLIANAQELLGKVSR
jgi:negative regulator of flagellin synthesis FlgM